MNTRPTSSNIVRLADPPTLVAQGLWSLRSRVALGWRAWQRAQRLRRDEAEFRKLDATTLRDLGMSASEHGSFWTEVEGLSPRTRTRALALHARRQGHPQ